MPTVPAASTLITSPVLAVPLARYAQLIEYDERAFFGLVYDDLEYYERRPIWTKPQRDTVEKYLREAQLELERAIGYPLVPTYIGGSDDPNLIDHQQYRHPITLRYRNFIEGGIRAETTISAGEAVDFTADPAVVGPVALPAGVTDPDELFLYFPNLDVIIYPSEITVAGGNVTFYIPWARLVAPANANNPETGLDYTDTTIYTQTVDVKRVYTDPETQAVFVKAHRCSGSCSSNLCADQTADGCIRAIDARLGIVEAAPGTYSNGAWTSTLSKCGPYETVRLNYVAGLARVDYQAEDAVLRLAHSKIPDEICGAEVWVRFWQRDRNIPDIATRERINCPFGLNDGAWVAWTFARSMKITGMSVL